MRLRHRRWTDEVLSTNSDIGITLDEIDDEIIASFTDLEIGSGLGGFLSSCAIKWPERKFLGVEVSRNAFASAIKKTAPLKAEHPNFLFINAPIERLYDHLSDGQFENIFINFPDPWPKKKHRPRRLTYPDKLEQYYRLLRDDGYLYFRTDDDDLFFDSIGYFEEFEEFHTTIITPFYSEETDVLPSTEYERKFRERGVDIHLIIATKKREKF